MNSGLDHLQIWCGRSLGISDDLIIFWEESIKNKMADGGHFEKNSHPKTLWAGYLMSRGFDQIRIWCGGSLGISDDPINF